MATPSGARLPENAHRPGRAARRRAGWASMSEKQAEAYLMARDVVRRIQRTCSLVPTQRGPGRADGGSQLS